VLEVDGAFHDDVMQSSADRARHRKLTALDRIVISYSAYELRHDPASVMEDLIALGVPRVRAS
jgi:very-short-patch-repair endonuclease